MTETPATSSQTPYQKMPNQNQHNATNVNEEIAQLMIKNSKQTLTTKWTFRFIQKEQPLLLVAIRRHMLTVPRRCAIRDEIWQRREIQVHARSIHFGERNSVEIGSRTSNGFRFVGQPSL